MKGALAAAFAEMTAYAAASSAEALKTFPHPLDQATSDLVYFTPSLNVRGDSDMVSEERFCSVRGGEAAVEGVSGFMPGRDEKRNWVAD